MNKNILVIILVSLLMVGCSATTTFESTEPGVSIQVQDKAKVAISESSQSSFGTTSFGNYRYKLTKDGMDPVYGLLPLKFNGGYLAADILFFAPAAFFNLREVFPFYKFNPETGEVSYKSAKQHNWRVYSPTKPEIENAKDYFNK